MAASAGLFLDPWQQWVLDHALSERADGKWCAYECCLLVPRQNGKGSILEALELFHLFVLRSKLVSHSAHEFKTAREHFLRMQALIKNTPELYAAVRQGGWIHTANGNESIGTSYGSRLNFVARSKGSGRGFSGDLIILDEAYKLPEEAIGAMGPSLSAMPNPQIWYTSSAPHADSHVLHAVRARGVAGDGDRLFFAEWGHDAGAEGTWENVYRVNPGAPHRLSHDNLVGEKSMMATLGDEWVRERLGVPSMEEGTEPGLILPDVWREVCDPLVEVTAACFGIDVSEERTWGSIVACGDRSIETVDYRQGVGWIADRAVELFNLYGTPMVVDAKGPAATLIVPLRDRGVNVMELSGDQLVKATGDFFDAVTERTVRVRPDADLNAAALGAAKRDVGDAFVWTRKNSHAEISLLVAATVALAGELLARPAEYVSLAEL